MSCFICQDNCSNACLQDLPWVAHHCTHCLRAVAHASAICPVCESQPSCYQYRVPLLYEAPISQVIAAFKLGQQEHLCVPLASTFVSRFSALKPDVLIPVPSHPKRIWERGYNPALLIARQLGKMLHIPVNDRAVARIHHSAPQRLQKKQARSHNVENVFQVKYLDKGLRIALVDDVVTTGETLRALASVVAPFAEYLECWAIAESPHIR